MALSVPKNAKPLVDGDELVAVAQPNQKAPILLRVRDKPTEKFVFATFMDNEPYHNMSHDDWSHLAQASMTRLCAQRGHTIMRTTTAPTGPFDFVMEWS